MRQDGWVDHAPAAGTPIDVEVHAPATRPRVTLARVERWLHGATVSPNDRVRKDRLKALLSTK